jgi:hypothetical protein
MGMKKSWWEFGYRGDLRIVIALVLFGLVGCCGEGTDFILCWKHTPIKTANGQLVHRYGTQYWNVK